MQETLKMMKSIIIGKECKLEEKELIEEYQEKLSPNILAYMFVRNYGMITKACKLYPLINEQDKASFCLQELDKALQNYNVENKVKFSTYFIKCFKNRLKTETNILNYHRNKIMNDILNLDDINEINNCTNMEIDNTDLMLQQYNLTDKEINQCKLLNEGYTIKEIAKMLKVSVQMIYGRNSKIKQKILYSGLKFE